MVFYSVKEQMKEATLFLAAPTSSNVFEKKKRLKWCELSEVFAENSYYSKGLRFILEST